MTIHQLSVLKQWHVQHRRLRPVEFHAWDVILTLWVLGLLGMPVEIVLSQFLGLMACGSLLFVPGGYVALRRRLHLSGRLRCDWLGALRP
jgi:hypothetical protein